jgi:hypothetical protein
MVKNRQFLRSSQQNDVRFRRFSSQWIIHFSNFYFYSISEHAYEQICVNFHIFLMSFSKQKVFSSFFNLFCSICRLKIRQKHQSFETLNWRVYLGPSGQRWPTESILKFWKIGEQCVLTGNWSQAFSTYFENEISKIRHLGLCRQFIRRFKLVFWKKKIENGHFWLRFLLKLSSECLLNVFFLKKLRS